MILIVIKGHKAVFLAFNICDPDEAAVYRDLILTQISNAAIQEPYTHLPGLHEVNCNAGSMKQNLYSALTETSMFEGL